MGAVVATGTTTAAVVTTDTGEQAIDAQRGRHLQLLRSRFAVPRAYHALPLHRRPTPHMLWPLIVLCRDERRRTNPRPYNTAFRVVVSGLPSTASWQDLKDHMRKGGEVTFAQVRHGAAGWLWRRRLSAGQNSAGRAGGAVPMDKCKQGQYRMRARSAC